ncbi:hypothetical protein [Lichenicoccus roseus]|uniref:hypothetical protein n=1 Tax=Lichenicoccus roseus TaxID=2683649 RepID=UPI001F0F8E0D|nr:hypothetical protein [Lichenicoccus roseus]
MTFSILDALDSPAVFAPHFRGGPASWHAWRAFLAALFALPMTDDDLGLYRTHTGRSEAPAAPFREAALICGRRAGKSRILALLAVYLAAFRDYGPHLASGEVATIAVIAADRRQARHIMRYVLGLIDGVPALAALKSDETGESVALGPHCLIEIHTASFRAVRGYTLAAVLIDEVAFLKTDELSANPDQEILTAVRPGLSSIPGSLLMIASSPYAKRGALYQAYRQHWGKDDARVLVWQGPTLAMNPTLDRALVAQAYEDDAARAAAEFGAMFRDDIAAFVSREVIDACTVPGRFELPFITGNTYHGFVDPSGGSSDSMTLAVAHLERDGLVQLDAVREVRPPFSPEGVVADFVALLKSYGIRRVRGDRYAGEWAREPFRKLGVEYQVCEQPRSDLYRDLLPRLNSRQVELLDLPRLSKQLCDLERRTARGGRDSIDHAPGAHDDIANAVAGALLMPLGAAPPMQITQAALEWARARPVRAVRW